MKLATTSTKVILKVGRLERVFTSPAEAVKSHNEMRDASGEGASTWPRSSLSFGGAKYSISYNGRVWGKTETEVAI